MSFYEKPRCVNSPDGSMCISSSRSTVVEVCQNGQFCENSTCKTVTDDSTITKASATTTSSSIKMVFWTITTTTMPIPDATFCFGRSESGSAHSQADCDGLICRGAGQSCKFIGDAESGHCTCK